MANKDFAPLMSMIKTLKAHTNHSPMSKINTMKIQFMLYLNIHENERSRAFNLA